MIVWPGLRRSVSAISRLFNSAAFDAPLTHSAIPTRAASGTTATFTRATTKTWPNNDGYLVTGVSGEIGFVGARRVDNLIRLGAAQSSTLAVAANVTMTLPAGAYQFSMGAGTGRVTFSGTGGATGTLDAVTTGRVHVAKTITAGTLIVTASVATLVDIQVVSMVAETDQTTIREYVSVGVASSPYYHGSMVDGVKCFATDINGAAIPSTTLLGYSAEGARTNLCLQSNAFTTTWAATGTGTITQNVVGPDGGTTAWTINDTDGAAYYFIQSGNITVSASTAYTVSVFIKKTSSLTVAPLVELKFTGGVATYVQQVINTVSGTATNFSGSTAPTSVTVASFNNDFWRVSIVATSPVGTTTANVTLYPAINADASATGVVATQGSAVFYGAQVELGSFASSYIPTTTIAVTRNADVLTYSSAGNILGTVGWCYAEVQRQSLDTSGGVYPTAIDIGTNRTPLIQFNGTSKLYISDGTTNLASTNSMTAGVVAKAGSYWGAGLGIATNGTPATAAFDGDMNAGTAINIGNNANSALYSWFGTIRNIRIGQRQLSASELQAVTA